ncbi:MAG: PD-(D/E)XK nuclease family protein [Bacteroidia bacterium]
MPIEDTYRIEVLESFEEILQSIPSQIDKSESTFFEISGFPHYERVIGNWYSFFLDPEESHGLGRLFIESLLSIISNEYPNLELSFDDVFVQQEFGTTKGNFIDILLTNSYLEPTEAMIIELKVNASVYNDLDDYFESIPADSKIGIVLSLNSVKIKIKDTSDYICITHYNLLQEVKSRLGSFIIKSNVKFNQYLFDFIANMETMSKPDHEMNHTINFYLQNIKNINSLIDIKSISENHFIAQLRSILMEYNFEYKSKSKQLSSYSYKPDENIVLYWYFGELSKGETEFELWLRKGAVADWLHVETEQKERLKNKYQDLMWEDRKDGEQWLAICRIKGPIRSFKDFSFQKYVQDIFTKCNIEELAKNVQNLLQ